MVTATDLKTGKSFEDNGIPYQVVRYTHQKIGRGGATVKLSVRNLKTGNLEEKTFNSTTKFEEISTQKRPLQYLYKDGITAYFMDPINYEQIEIPASVMENELKFIKEGEEVGVLFWGESALSVDIPPKVTLEVSETAPGVKGNTASNIYKPAKMENGITIKVPLFIKTGDKVRVDTRTSEYVERAR